jgi:two-component system cell cycle sensor histidine kinase/response regulator CckA
MRVLPVLHRPNSLDAKARVFAPGICGSYHLILLHSLVTIVLSYQLLFSASGLLSFEAEELVVLALIASVACLVILPARAWAGAWLVSNLVIADTLVTTAIIYASGQASSGLYLAYFLIILLAAVRPPSLRCSGSPLCSASPTGAFSIWKLAS